MSGRPQPKLPLAPLLLVARADGPSDLARKISGDGWGTRSYSTVVRSLDRARVAGLTIAAADRYALALGLHPRNVWAEWEQPSCDFCDQVLDDEPHWAHEPDCPRDELECRCTLLACPDCCPTCLEETGVEHIGGRAS